MSLLILKFSTRNKHYTWFINDNWIPLMCFFLTLGLGLIYKKYFLTEKSTKTLPNPRGGEGTFLEKTFDDFIDLCIEPGHAYESVHSGLTIVTRRLVQAPVTGLAIIVTSEVLIRAYAKLLRETATKISILGAEFFFENLRDTLLKSVGVIGSALFLALYSWNPLTPTALILAVSLGLNIVTKPIDCSSFVLKLPSEPKHQIERRLPPVPGEKPQMIHYATLPPEKPDKVFIKDDEKSEIFVPTGKVDCEPSKALIIKRRDRDKTVIKQKCEREYIPLKQRTRTLADIKDPAEPYLTRHAERLKKQREDIHKNREKVRVKNQNEYRHDNWEF
jgi:hypothetical protein